MVYPNLTTVRYRDEFAEIRAVTYTDPPLYAVLTESGAYDKYVSADDFEVLRKPTVQWREISPSLRIAR